MEIPEVYFTITTETASTIIWKEEGRRREANHKRITVLATVGK